MEFNSRIEVGQTVTAIFPWGENELPTEKNFLTGRVTEIIEKSAYAVYVRIAGLERNIPIDRVSAV